MNLGLILAIGESLKDFESKGQLKRLLNYNVRKYSKSFDKVFIFSYANETFKTDNKVFLIPNKSNMHRYFYALFMPIIHRKLFIECDILRGLQLTGGIPAAVSKVLLGKKYVINYGYDYVNFAKIEKKPIQSYLFKILTKPLLKFSDAVIITSHSIKRDVVGIISPAKVHYIPNGVDTNIFRPPKTNYTRTLKIVFMGRLEEQKNLKNLIKAVSETKKAINLEFYGKGSQKKELLNLATKLGVNLSIHDPVEYEKVPITLASCDIFALPSLAEGNPKILLEAMACERAVIGANVDGIDELIKNGHTGILTDTDYRSIAEAINKLSSIKLRNKLGQNARKFIMKNFNIDQTLKKEIGLLKTIANEK